MSHIEFATPDLTSYVKLKAHVCGTYLVVSCDSEGEEYYSFSGLHNSFESLSNYYYDVEDAEGFHYKLKLIDVFPEVEKHNDYTRDEIKKFLEPREILIKTAFELHSETQIQFEYCNCELYKTGYPYSVDARSLRVDLLIQTDWEYPSLAETFGWSPSKCDSEGSCTCDIESAQEFLDDNAGEIVVDPGYFTGE